MNEACGKYFFAENDEPWRLLIADGPVIDCPFAGRFIPFNNATTSNSLGQYHELEEPQACNTGWIQGGCPLGSNMLINFCHKIRMPDRDLITSQEREMEGEIDQLLKGKGCNQSGTLKIHDFIPFATFEL